MSQKNWRLLFQEKALFMQLLESDSGKLTRAEALVLVQGEGRRLDELVREGWILIQEEDVYPGASLLVADVIRAFSLAETRQMWELSRRQLGEAIMKMEAAETPGLREQAGSLVFKKMGQLKSWAFLLHAAILQDDPGEGVVIAEEFDSIAAELRSKTLRSSGFPEWETTQWQLVDLLEERAAYLRIGDGNQDSDRLRKIKTLTRLRAEEALDHTNLESIVRSGDFLLLHKQLGIVSWPFFPLTAPDSSEQVTEIQVERQELSLKDMITGWQASGLDLLTFLEKGDAGMNVTETQKLETFSRILAESGEGLIWKKDSSGKKWEVWPGNQ